MKSNSISTPGKSRKFLASVSDQESASTASSFVVVNEQMVEMMVTGRVPQAILHPELQSAPPAATPEDTELTKWKAVEMFKVRINSFDQHKASVADTREFSSGDGDRRCHQRELDTDDDRPLRSRRYEAYSSSTSLFGSLFCSAQRLLVALPRRR